MGCHSLPQVSPWRWGFAVLWGHAGRGAGPAAHIRILQTSSSSSALQHHCGGAQVPNAQPRMHVDQVKAAPHAPSSVTRHRNELGSENQRPFAFTPQKHFRNLTCFPDKEPQMMEEVSLSLPLTFPTANQGMSGEQQENAGIRAGHEGLPVVFT